MADDKRYTVELIYPMPMNMAGQIMQAIGTLWPEATVSNSARGMTMHLPDVAAKRVGKRALCDAVAAVDASEDVLLTGGGVGDVTVSVPKSATWALAAWAAEWLTSEAAPNYVEQLVELAEEDAVDGKRRLLLTACWSKEQTPHELRLQAEARADAEKARADELQARLERIVALTRTRVPRDVAAKVVALADGHGH